MSCEHHREPGSVVKKLKKIHHYEPGAHSNHAYNANIKQQQEKRQVDNLKRMEETEKLAKEIVYQLPPDLHYPVSERDSKSNEIRSYNIHIVHKNDRQVAYTSHPDQKPKWVNFTSFCVFTHIFKRDENGFSVPDPEKLTELIATLPQTRKAA